MSEIFEEKLKELLLIRPVKIVEVYVQL